jgi:dephospho-CoA kinase
MVEKQGEAGRVIFVMGHMGAGKTTIAKWMLERGWRIADLDYGRDVGVEAVMSAIRAKAFAATEASQANELWDKHNAIQVPVTRTRLAMYRRMAKYTIVFGHGLGFLTESETGYSDAYKPIMGVIALSTGSDDFRERLKRRDGESKYSDEFLRAHYDWYWNGVWNLQKRYGLRRVDVFSGRISDEYVGVPDEYRYGRQHEHTKEDSKPRIIHEMEDAVRTIAGWHRRNARVFKMNAGDGDVYRHMVNR